MAHPNTALIEGLRTAAAGLVNGNYYAWGHHENGHWPPHLHFQIILDMQLKEGDYPGVCKYSEREKYLANCPDPDLILQLNQYIKA